MPRLLVPQLLIIPFLLMSATTAAQSRLQTNVDQIEAYLDQRDLLAPEVSAVDVAWHLDHMLRVLLVVHDQLAASDPAEYAYTFKLVRTYVMTLGRFPRGVAEAPKSVRPADVIRTEDIRARLAEVRAMLPTLDELEKQQFFDHFRFGKLNRRRSIKFLGIHTRHHLRIVRDIVEAAGE